MTCGIKVSLALDVRGYHTEMPLVLPLFLKFASGAAVRAQMLINTFQSLALLGP